MSAYRALLKQRNFCLFWLGHLTSSFGDYLYMLAIMWLTLQMTGSAVHMSMVVLAFVVPRLLFGLLGGGYADRWDRRKMMIASDFMRGTVVLMLPIVYTFNMMEVWHLYLLGFMLGTVGCFFEPAHQAILPSIVKKEELTIANALNDATNRFCRIFIPLLLSGLVLLMPIHMVFVVCAVTFFISGIALYLMQVPHKISVEVRAGVWREIGDMLYAVRRMPRILFTTLATVFGLAAWMGAYQVGIPILADKQLDVGMQGYSFIIAAYGAGNFVASILYYKLPIRDKANWVMYGWVMVGLGFLILAVSTNLIIALLGAFIAATGGPISTLSRIIMVQEEVENKQMGKVFSLGATLISVATALSLVVTGPIFEMLSTQASFVVYGSFILLVGVAGKYVLRSSEPKSTASEGANKAI